MIVAYFCILIATQQTLAVVNNGQNTEDNTSDTNTKTAVTNENSANNASAPSVPDSLAESSDTVRREAPFTISASYELPFQGNSAGLDNSYQPSSSNNVGLPVPVYGVPDAPSNNFVYPGPPPDIPPAQNQPINNIYGPPVAIPLPPVKFQSTFFSSQSKPFNYPKPLYGPPQSYSHGPQFGSSLKSQYGPPKPYYASYKSPKPIYGPPHKLNNKPYFGLSKPLFNANKPSNAYGPPNGYYNIPKDNFGPPKDFYGPPKQNYGPPKPIISVPSVPVLPALPALPPSPPIQYGPPEPIPHGPPHPGAPAPPTPPDIKYDGWQPIPGLVSRPPSDSYGVPKDQSAGLNDLQQNINFLPPIEGILGDSLKGEGLSDSYGAPLNAVTGSGGIISSSGDTLRGNGGTRNELSVVKSLGFDLSPPHNGGGNLNINNNFIGDSYSAPPLNSYSSNGPYAAAHSYKNNDVLLLPSLENFASSLANSFDTTLQSNQFGNNFGNQFGNQFNNQFSSGIGLIPPSGLYGVPPNGKYGTPLIHPPNKYGPPINFKPPKHPVIFRDPVPTGLIQSIGKAVAQKDAHGIIDNIHSNKFSGPAYVPPPVPDISDFNKHYKNGPPNPSNLYSLPSKNSLSFQNIAHGSSSFGLNNNFNSDFNFNGGNYGAPYALPQASSHLPVYSGAYSNYQNVGYDCSHKSQIFGVPPSNGYSNAGPSLNTNFGGVSDLHIAHSQPNSIVSGSNSNFVEDNKLNINGKSIADSFAPGGELVKSESIDLNNIPLQGALGSYTLQIQSANGDGSENKIPHNQVFNDQLFHSILNAIEQPQQNSQSVLGQSVFNFQQLPPQSQGDYQVPHQPQGYQLLPQSDSSYSSGDFSQFNVPNIQNTQNNFHHDDSDGQNSITKSVVVSPPPSDSSGANKETVTNEPQIDDLIEVPQIDNNEIAIYFNKTNTDNDQNTNKQIEVSNELNQNRNGQQYGSYVSFKSENANFEYGDINVKNSTVMSDSKSSIIT